MASQPASSKVLCSATLGEWHSVQLTRKISFRRRSSKVSSGSESSHSAPESCGVKSSMAISVNVWAAGLPAARVASARAVSKPTPCAQRR